MVRFCLVLHPLNWTLEKILITFCSLKKIKQKKSIVALDCVMCKWTKNQAIVIVKFTYPVVLRLFNIRCINIIINTKIPYAIFLRSFSEFLYCRFSTNLTKLNKLTQISLKFQSLVIFLIYNINNKKLFWICKLTKKRVLSLGSRL